MKIFEQPLDENSKTYYIGTDHPDFKEPKTLRNKVFEALGEVSMCWSETPKGIFDSTNAERIGNELMKDIKDEITKAIVDTMESIGKQQFLQNVGLKENYEVVSGRFTFKGTSLIEENELDNLTNKE